MATKNNFFTRFNPPPSFPEDTSKPSMTEQQYGYQCNINNLVETIVDRNGRQCAKLTHAGTIASVNSNEPIYGDFTQFTSDKLHEGLNTIVKANSMFSNLPSSIRDRFGNDPSKLIDFCNDSKNYDEGVKLGLFKKRVVQDVVPDASSVVQPATPVKQGTSSEVVQ